MVAIVSGNSLGLSLSSLSTLGPRGVLGSAAQGRGGDGAYVNVANGNLVLQGQDDRLVGRGLGVGVLRTYNSQGLLGDDNGDNWHVGAYGQRVVLTGTLGTAGSVLIRTDRDGASATYSWDATRNQYVSTAGAGAFDTIVHDGANSTYVWTDGATGLVERYDAAGQGRLISVADPSGNTIAYAYNSNGTLQSMVNANGEVTYFDYSGTNLTQIRTVASDATMLTRVRYAYDASNRLSTVTVDLSPQDNSVADGKTYVTTYTYDGTSKRVASVTQSDGTSLEFTYVQVAANDWRVATVKDGLGQTTSYSYDMGTRTTAVTDPLGLVTVYSYDLVGQLTQIKAPAVAGGVSQVTAFNYDATGNVVRITDALGLAVDMAYDANGNQVLQRDAAGNTITRSFDSHNRLLTETVYLTPDPDGAGTAQPGQPQTTRHVYDTSAKGLLRFVLSPEGRVVEHRYDSYGQRVASLEYAAGRYNTAALGVTVVPTEGEMATWAGAQDRTQASRTDMEYDARGQVQKVTVYSRMDAGGAGVVDGTQSVTQYVYDRAGLLLSTVSATAGTTAYTYDGKGRQLSAQDALNQVTLTSYDDASNKTIVTLASGLITTSAYDKNGRLISISQGSAQAGSLGTSTYGYDKLNRLVSQTDATGARLARLYDEVGRLVGEVSGAGRLTEYVYDKDNQVTHKVVYATAVNSAALAAYLEDPNAIPLNRLDALRPTSSATDQKSWRIYDSAGRLVRTVDAAGAVVDFSYDGASRLVSSTRYSKPLAASVLAGLGGAPTLAATVATADPVNDRVERRFYDGDGLLLGVLDAEGYFTESRYDGQGRLLTQIAYANPAAAGLRATGTLAQLIPDLDATKDQTTRWLYDALDRVVGQIDAEGYLTERVYDVSGNVLKEIRYDTQLTASVLGQITGATLIDSLRPGVLATDRTVVSLYDKLNRVTQRTNYEGTVTQYVYDKVGNVVSTTSAAGTADARVLGARYDVMGRLVGELTGVGGALLVPGLTQAQIDAIWTQYGLTHAYDAAGRRISTTDGYGNKTLFYYDLNGQLTHSINALGEVQERQYDALGQLSATIQYGTRLASLAGLSGGLVNIALTTAVDGIKATALDTKTSFTYTLRGELASATDALGNITSTSYNAFGDLTSRVQDLGGGAQRTQTTTVDRRGQVVGVISDSAGVNAITSAVYDAFGRLSRSTDASGNVLQQNYDRLGRVVSTIDGMDSVRASSYDAFGRVKTLTDALGRVTSYAYDDALRTVTIKTPENVSVRTSYTRQGQKLSVVDGNGNTTSFGYDENGNLLSTTTADGAVTNTYDRTNRLIQTRDARGTVVELTYDATNRLLTRTVDKAGLNLVTTYGYDAKGQQISVTDPNGTVTNLDYNAKGQLIRKEVDPAATGLKLVTRYTYDAEGNTLTIVDPAGTTTQYVYDNLGRRTQERVDPTGLNLTREYTYDKNGNVIARKEPGGEMTRYVYDAEDRLVYTLDATGGLQRLYYDLQGRVTQSVRYAEPIELDGLPPAPAALTGAQLQARVKPGTGTDYTEHRVLDKDGRLLATVNGLGEVVRYVYDGNGNVVTRTAYANRITLAGWMQGTVPSPTPDPARDQVLRSVYDASNRVVYTIDGVGAVKRNVYDANGNLAERIAYATTVPPDTAATETALHAAIEPRANSARDLREVFEYDRANRLSKVTDGVGAVTLRTYDNNGNLVRLERGGASVTLYAYDPANRLVYTVGPLGELEQNTYDAAGRVAKVTRYATAIVMAGLVLAPKQEQLQALVRADAAIDQVQHNVYDKAGRLVASVNALGETVRYTLDANGRVLERRAYFNPVNMTTWLPGSVPAPLSDDSRDQKTLTFYDAAGREQLSVDALGHAQQKQYDALGRMTRLTRYPKPVPAATASNYQALVDAANVQAALAGLSAQITVIVYDAAGRKTSQTEAWGRPEAATTAYVYNGLGLLTQTVEARGVELSQSDSIWARVQRQELGYVNAGGGGLLQASLTQVQRDALATLYTTTYVYDAAGRRISVADPLGGVTQSAYDANGNVVKITDPRGSTAYYYFDAAGRVVLSVDPEGYATATTYNSLGKTQSIKRHFSPVTGTYSDTQAPQVPTSANDAFTQFEYDAAGRLLRTVDAENHDERYSYNALGQRKTLDNKLRGVTSYEYDRAGRLLAETLPITSKNAAGQSAAVVNRYTYDAFGNKVTSTEAAGLPEQRITTYDYDALNRQVTVRQSTVSVYTQAGGWSTAAPTRTSTYDANGNLIMVVDANGGRIRSWFDANNRKIAEVSATGTLSRWTYDAAGNVLTLSVYGDRLNLPVGDSLPAPVDETNSRQTTYKVDANNRVISSTIADVSVGWYDETTGQYNYGPGKLAQETIYDANGNVVRQKDGAGALTYAWYDKLGHKVLEVDREGYVVRWERDANGAVVKETRFAKPIPAIDLALLGESRPASDVLAKVPEQTSTANRITTYAYDRNGRVLSESRLNVVNGTVNASTGAIAEGTATATKRYGYDAMGNQTSVTDAMNQRTDLAYDELGRLRLEQKPQAANETGISVRQTREYEYDGLNNVRREIRRGEDNSSEGDDQIVRYGYDATGVRTSMITAKGESFAYGRDANGNTTAQLIDRRDADGVLTKEIISVAYDADNREISRFLGTRDAANAPVYDVSRSVSMTYNAYGQISSKKTGSGNAAGGAQEYYDYDKAGRLWRTNSQGGVNKAWVYDLAGNAALQMESQTQDLRAFATVGDLMNEALGKIETQILTTITAYNKRNQATSVTQPKVDATRPNLVMVATQLSVDSGQFGGLNITVGSSQQGQGTSSILGPIYGNSVARGGQMPPGAMVGGGSYRYTEIGTQFVNVFDFTNIAFGSAEMDATYRALYGHIPAWKVVVRGPNGVAVERAVEGGGGWPKWLFDFGTYVDVDLNSTTVELYAITASGKQVQAGRTLAKALLTWGGIAQVPSGTFLRLSEGEIPADATVQLYHRPQGSSGPYEQSLPIFRAGEAGSSLNNVAVDGWYMTRLDGWGPTELLWVVTRSDGAVLRRDAINWSPPNGTSSWVAPSKPVFRSDGWTHFTGLRTSGGGEPSFIRIHQRPQGSTGEYSVYEYGQVGRGRFEAWIDSGDRDVMIELLDGNRQVIERQRGLVNRGNQTYNMQRISELPSTIKFQGIPLNATTLTVNYTPTGAGKPAGSFTVTRDVGATEWLWDTQAAGLVLDNRYTYNYNISFVARDSDGFKLTEATGNVTVGAIAGTTGAQLTGSSKPQVLSFDPGIAEGRTLKIRYREKGAAAQPVPVYGPPVIAGYNADGTAIFGKGYSAPIVGKDALGKPIYGVAVATPYHVEETLVGTWQEVRQYPGAKAIVDRYDPYVYGIYYDRGDDGWGFTPWTEADMDTWKRSHPQWFIEESSDQFYLYAFPGHNRPEIVIRYRNGEMGDGPVYRVNSNYQVLYSVVVVKPEIVTPEDPSKFITGLRTLDFLEVTASRTPSGVFKWDATNAGLKQNKQYEYLYDVYNASNVVVASGEGYFRPDNSGNNAANVNIRWIIPGIIGPAQPGQASEINSHWRVQRRQDYDAFGQVIRETDGRDNVTALNYNTLGQLIDKVGPATTIRLANGQEQTVTPTEHYSYDLNGQLVGKRDANGNQSTLVLDALGQVTAEWHPGASGGSVAINKAYDIFGNLRKVTDEVGRVTNNEYDKNNRLTRVDRPANSDGSRAFDLYQYDELGQRIAHQNALGFRERTYYDSMGRVVRYISAEGREVKYGFTYDNTIASAGGVNTGGWISTTTSAISDTELRVQTLKNDVFGRLMWKQDLGGHEFTYSYNWSGLIATQIGTSGQNITYSYYGNGYLRKVIDTGVATESYFEYDGNGNRTFEGYKSTVGDAAMVFQQSTVTYDAFNRIKKIQDGRYTIEYEYDANGNRRRVHSLYNDGLNGTRAEQDYWYQYDGMNRFTVTMGQLVGGQIVRGSSGDGVSIEYDNAGQRKAAIYASDGHREDYAYDGAGALTTTHINGILRARRTNDLAGRVTLYEEFKEDQTWSQSQRRSWDKDNLIVREDDNLKLGAYTTYSRLKDGTLSGTDSMAWTFANNSWGWSAQKSRYSYEWWDTAKQKEITVIPNDSSLPQGTVWAPGFSRFVYDINGHIKEANDSQGNRTFKYWTDAEGRVLQRDEYMGGSFFPVGLSGGGKNRTHHYFYFDGKRVGNVGNDGTEREDYAQQLAREPESGMGPDSRYKKFTPISSADFDENFQPINASYPGTAPGSYTVRTGDTLESIARTVWGDATLWYLLAEANGLSGQPAVPLVANTVLTIPNRVTNVHNTSDTFRPYDPGKAMGDTSPTLPPPILPPSNDKERCGGFGEVIVIVVSIVAAVFTAGSSLSYFNPGAVAGATVGGTALSAASPFMIGAGVFSGSIGGMGALAVAGAGALGGAVGSIAGQLTGMGLGIQDKFSWKGVLQGALSGGVSAGVGTWLNSGGALGGALAGKEPLEVAGRLAASNVVGQGIGMAMGLQRRFDWRGVAASAASGYVSAWVGQSPTFFGQDLATRLAGGMVSAAVRGGSLSSALPGIMVDALGATVGNALGDSLAGAMGQKSDSSSSTYVSPEEKLRDQFWADFQRPMGDGIPRVNGLTFSETVARGQAALDPLGIRQMAPQPQASNAYAGDVDNWDLMGTPRSVGVAGREASRGAWGIASSLAGQGASGAEINQVKNQLLALNPELAEGVKQGQLYYVPDADTPENLGLAKAADRVYAAQLQARAEARANRAAEAAQAATASYGAGGGRGFVNPADASTYGGYPFAGRSTITGPAAFAASSPASVSDLVLKGDRMPLQTDWTRAEVQAAQSDLAQALRNSTDNRERLSILGSLRSVAEAGYNSGVLTPDEVLGAPGALEFAAGSMAFGGSSGAVPTGISKSIATPGPAFRSSNTGVSVEYADPVSGTRLANQLRNESARSPFMKNGELTQEAISDSTLIIPPSQITNPAIPQGLGKYSTQTFQSEGGNFQMHYYKNPTTGEVYYHLDYKAVYNSMSGVQKKP